ncbi:hypothetical protein EGU54_32195, partial [Achromobacter aegrifaciens]
IGSGVKGEDSAIRRGGDYRRAREAVRCCSCTTCTFLLGLQEIVRPAGAHHAAIAAAGLALHAGSPAERLG